MTVFRWKEIESSSPRFFLFEKISNFPCNNPRDFTQYDSEWSLLKTTSPQRLIAKSGSDNGVEGGIAKSFSQDETEKFP
jgi:hypothetical protein